MSAFVYVLYSPTRGRTYVGCSEDVAHRLQEHQKGHVTSTRSGRPWVVVLQESHASMLEARRRERYLKSSAGRRWLQNRLGNLHSGSPARLAERDEASPRE